jgi:hypothetical protein
MGMNGTEAFSYLENVWSHVVRRTGKTERSFEKIISQEDLCESLSKGCQLVDDKDARGEGDMRVFNTQCLHRGGASTGTEYSCFFAWQSAAYKGLHFSTDEIPVHKTNWKARYEDWWLRPAEKAAPHRGNHFYALANNIPW